MLWKKVKWAIVGAILPASASGEEPAAPRQAAMRAPDREPVPAQKTLEIATDPDHPAPTVRIRREVRAHGGCGSPGGHRFYGGARLTGSRVYTRGAAAGYGGRAEIEVIYTSRRHAGVLFGVVPLALEGWGSSDGGGGGVPFNFYFGVGSPRFFLHGGGGWEWLLLDKMSADKGDIGVGLMAPLATASAGFWIDRIRFMVDARAMYRWHLNTEHRAQTSLGFSLGLPLGN